MVYNIQDIATIINASTNIVVAASIRYLLTDSRTLYYPNESLFFAIETSTNNGHKYIDELIKLGVKNFVVHQMNEKWEHEKANFLVVNNTLEALHTLAQFHRQSFAIPIVGITGSNGKTIVKEWLNQLLQEHFHITRSPKSYNSQIGVPLSICLLNESSELGIFEAGISMPNEMKALQKIIQPTIGIFTGIGQAHQENFSSMEEKLNEKISLFSSCQVVINQHNTLFEESIKKINPDIQTFSWSYQPGSNASITIQKVDRLQQTTRICYEYQQQRYEYLIPFIDEASIENSLHCLSFCHWLAIDASNIAQKMANLETVAMRLEKKQGNNNCLIINDTYNSDIHSLQIALDLLAYSANHNFSKLSIVLSDIIQSGEDDASIYQQVASALKQKGVHKLLAVGERIKKHADLFDLEAHFFTDTSSLIHSNILDEVKNEAILVKGARSFQFEQIVNKLELKLHETVLEVNLNALVHNYNVLKTSIKPDTKTMCMIKANGYGCGAIEVAKTLQYHRCDYFGVAVADEGVELRKAGIYTPIIVMNPELSSFDAMFEYHLEPEIYSFRILKQLAEHAQKLGLVNYPIHIKIDTGMHRLGFEPHEIDELIKEINRYNALQIQSIFTHLVGADDAQFDDFTHQQVTLFNDCYQKIQSHFKHPIIRHVLNSAGVERFPTYHFDMVRLGIGLYGVGNNEQSDIQPLLTLKTIILQLKKVQANDTIGYSRKGKLFRDSVIATIPIGYADGLRRHLSNGKGYVLINGKKAPIIGNVCMDISMVDVSDIADVKEGDSVIVIGDKISIQEVAKLSDTIPYEILTGISQRVKRIYYQE